MPSTLSRPLRLVHISDTHNWHNSIESTHGRLPCADILIITGDVTNKGDDYSLGKFNAWLGEIAKRYGYSKIIMIPGNHDWWDTQKRVGSRELSAEQALDPSYMQRKITNAHVLCHELVTVDGLTIYGSTYDPWQSAGNPDRVADHKMRPKGWSGAHRYGEIPPGTHIVLTHVPPAGIFDCTRNRAPGGRWGSSADLLREIKRKGCLAHFFGHLHEQRGFWVRSSSDEDFTGGTEFTVKGRPFYTNKPKPTDTSCLLISCNAMVSHPDKDGLPFHMAGPPRLVVAEPSDTPEGIRFRVVKHGSKEYLGHGQPAPLVPLGPASSSGHKRSKRVWARPSQELVSKYAEHFNIMPNLVEDVLGGILASNSCSPDELEDQAIVVLSGMCDAPSDSESDGGPEDEDAKYKRQKQ
jgi:Icc-related predicted phosphoesterase